jgi:hypothetical protein
MKVILNLNVGYAMHQILLQGSFKVETRPVLNRFQDFVQNFPPQRKILGKPVKLTLKNLKCFSEIV